MNMEINVNKFKEMLLLENEKQNLISRKSGKEELEKHISDSLKVMDFINFDGMNVIDIGSGAGFPGLLLAIANPLANFTLIEADLKKSYFLHQVCSELVLSNVRVVRERAEVIGKDELFRERFDLCTSRAVAAMNIMLEYGIPLVQTGGYLLLWKGRNYQEEIDASQNAFRLLDAKVENKFLYNLMEERDRAIVMVRKERKTSDKYPRRIGLPAKRPL